MGEPKTTQDRIDTGLARIASEVESLRGLVLDAPLVQDLERQLADKDAEIVSLHEELDDLRSELAGHEDVEHDLEAKIEQLEGELCEARAKVEERESNVFDTADGLCDLIMQALGAENAVTDSFLVYSIYRAVEEVRAEMYTSGTHDHWARLKQLQRECGAGSFVEQLQKGA